MQAIKEMARACVRFLKKDDEIQLSQIRPIVERISRGIGCCLVSFCVGEDDKYFLQVAKLGETILSPAARDSGEHRPALDGLCVGWKRQVGGEALQQDCALVPSKSTVSDSCHYGALWDDARLQRLRGTRR